MVEQSSLTNSRSTWQPLLLLMLVILSQLVMSKAASAWNMDTTSHVHDNERMTSCLMGIISSIRNILILCDLLLMLFIVRLCKHRAFVIVCLYVIVRNFLVTFFIGWNIFKYLLII